MKVFIIAAVAENDAIGKNNDLIWNLPNDMKFFKEKTLGKTIITGRKNYESIPERYRPLPNRKNIVVTNQHNYEAPGAIIAHSLEEALSLSKDDREVFIIGGGEIYRAALSKNLVDTMYLTEVHASFEADTFFPAFDEQDWEVEDLAHHPTDDNHAYAFTFKRLSKKKSS